MAPKSKSIAGYFGAPKRLKNEQGVVAPSPSTCGDLDEKQATEDGEINTVQSLETQEILTQEQKIRVELNKSAADAIRNIRICEDRVASAKAQGLSFPDFKDLLVESSWLKVLASELEKPYVEKLSQFVRDEASAGYPIYPPAAKIFTAFNSCPFHKVKVVILGQDPYHGPGQAMGLCFSVEKGVKFPPSLLNIFKEIQNDVGCTIPPHGNLEKWSYQGVLLLNTVLTVHGGKPNSHAKKGWEEFTDAAIKSLSSQRSGIVFLLWGSSAQEKISSYILSVYTPAIDKTDS